MLEKSEMHSLLRDLQIIFYQELSFSTQLGTDEEIYNGGPCSSSRASLTSLLPLIHSQ